MFSLSFLPFSIVLIHQLKVTALNFKLTSVSEISKESKVLSFPWVKCMGIDFL